MDFPADLEDNEPEIYEEEHITLSFAGPEIDTQKPSKLADGIERNHPQPASGSASHEAANSFLKPPMEHYKARRLRSAPLAVDGEDSLVSPEAALATSPLRIHTKTKTDVSLPPTPLFRPTTFWRNTKRSGVTGASYSPGCYLIRRSTFVAAGLSLENPTSDLSAFGVESRVGVVFLPPDTSLEEPART